MLNIEEFWADGSYASRQLSSRLEEKKRRDYEAYRNSWRGQQEIEDKQRNAIAAFALGYRREE